MREPREFTEDDERDLDELRALAGQAYHFACDMEPYEPTLATRLQDEVIRVLGPAWRHWVGDKT